MRRIETSLPGAYLIEPAVFSATFAPGVVLPAATWTGADRRADRAGELLEQDGSPARISYFPAARLVAT